MNSKIAYSFLCVILLTIPLGYAIKCYRCFVEDSCQSPSYVECSAVYATETIFLLDYYFQNVTTVVSDRFDCLRLDMNNSISFQYYKGCIYSTMSSCGYTLKPSFNITPPLQVECSQCSSDGCNPADRSYASAAALVLPLLFVFNYVVQ